MVPTLLELKLNFNSHFQMNSSIQPLKNDLNKGSVSEDAMWSLKTNKGKRQNIMKCGHIWVNFSRKLPIIIRLQSNQYGAILFFSKFILGLSCTADDFVSQKWQLARSCHLIGRTTLDSSVAWMGKQFCEQTDKEEALFIYEHL